MTSYMLYIFYIQLPIGYKNVGELEGWRRTHESQRERDPNNELRHVRRRLFLDTAYLREPSIASTSGQPPHTKARVSRGALCLAAEGEERAKGRLVHLIGLVSILPYREVNSVNFSA